MLTEYININPRCPQEELINMAVDFLKAGELIAFPTETVYGLGADAFNQKAINKIFQVKERPATSPLLVHVSNIEQVEKMTRTIPSTARDLMEQLWPGPLSIILPSYSYLPAGIRGENNSIGFRMPSHPVAIALIEKAGPIAAPSANLHGRPSPVNAVHVRNDLNGKIAAVLDAGSTGTGLESTIIDLSGEKYSVLRRGGIAVEKIEKILRKNIDIHESNEQYYDINFKIILARDWDDLKTILGQEINGNKKIAVLHNKLNHGMRYKRDTIHKEYELDMTGHSGSFYSILRDAEEEKVDLMLIEPWDTSQAGISLSILDRIKRAASNKFKE